MKATIKLTMTNDDGVPTVYEAVWDGETWTSEEKFVARFLNAKSAGWVLQKYYPEPVRGLALEIVESLKQFTHAEYVGTDKEIDYSQYPEGTRF